jgi:FkbM family methyltransferase
MTKIHFDKFNIDLMCREDCNDEFITKESEYFRFIKLNPNDIWIDAGGHIGSFALKIFREVNAVHVFEPDVHNFSLITENISLNNAQNIFTSHSALVGNNDKARTFFQSKSRNMGAGSFFKPPRRKNQQVTVTCTNINTVLHETRANCLKLDIEGAEKELLESIDLSHIDQLIMEYHKSIIPDFDYQAILNRNFPNVKIRKYWQEFIIYASK